MTVKIANLTNSRAYANVLSDVVALIEATMKQDYTGIDDVPTGAILSPGVETTTFTAGTPITLSSTTPTVITLLNTEVEVLAGQKVFVIGHLNWSLNDAAGGKLVLQVTRDGAGICIPSRDHTQVATLSGTAHETSVVAVETPGAGTFMYALSWNSDINVRPLYAGYGSLAIVKI